MKNAFPPRASKQSAWCSRAWAYFSGCLLSHQKSVHTCNSLFLFHTRLSEANSLADFPIRPGRACRSSAQTRVKTCSYLGTRLANFLYNSSDTSQDMRFRSPSLTLSGLSSTVSTSPASSVIPARSTDVAWWEDLCARNPCSSSCMPFTVVFISFVVSLMISMSAATPDLLRYQAWMPGILILPKFVVFHAVKYYKCWSVTGACLLSHHLARHTHFIFLNIPYPSSWSRFFVPFAVCRLDMLSC